MWFEHFYQSLQAAVAGGRIAIGPVALVADDLATGALCAPRGLVADGSRYLLMAPMGEGGRAASTAVLAWLRGACESLPAGQP